MIGVESFKSYYEADHGIGSASSKTLTELRNYFYEKEAWAFPSGTGIIDADILYYNSGTNLFHAARKRGCTHGHPKWIMFESKDGKDEKIEHRPKQTKYGGPNLYYVIGD